MAPSQNSRLLIPVGNFGPWARAIARCVVEMERAPETDVFLLHVFDEEAEQATADQTEGVDSSTDIDALAETLSAVKTAGNVLTAAKFEYSTLGVLANDLGPGILTAATQHDVDRIYMHSRERSPTGKAVFGSTIAHVLSNATVPVVVLPSGATRNRTDRPNVLK